MLELYHHGSSVCAAKVRLVLAEKGVDWTGRYVDILAGEQFDPAYLRLNPKGVVPTLVHGDRVIPESSVICEYLDDAFPAPPLKPAEAGDRAAMRLWTKKVDDEIHPAIRPITYVITHRHAILEKSEAEIEQYINNESDPYARERKRGWIRQGVEAPDVKAALLFYDRLLREMDAVLTDRDWIAGAQYSLADAALTPFINRLEMFGFSEMWADLPGLTRWWTAVKARPSFRTALFDYFPEDLQTRMRADGQRAWPVFKEMLTAAGD